jgi:type IV pilus assembly protein PilM
MASSAPKPSHFYHDKPVFGLDIGFSSLKVMQLDHKGPDRQVTGYGVTRFDPAAMTEGIITDPEKIAAAIYELLDKNLVGEITTRRVAVSIPASRTFNRTMSLPVMKKNEIYEAVRLEAEQYIPVPIDELYMDYGTISQSDKGTELLAVAVPKRIIDSYIVLMNLLGLEPVTMETTISAASRLFVQAEQSDVPAVLIDLGSLASDLTVFDKTLIVTGTVPGGGDSFTGIIADALKVSREEAHVIKTKYGLGFSKKQKEITTALTPILEQLGKEIRRMVRYYEERTDTSKKIGQIVTMGGGANMPGLSEYLTSSLRLPVRMCDPWQHLDFDGLQPPSSAEKSMYVTASGLALINPKEIFK